MTLPAYGMNLSSFPEMYERFLVEPLFRPFADVLVERVAVHTGQRVLDIACGTGIVARLARARVGDSGRVVGVDVSPQMLDVARAMAPGVEWRQGSADALPLEDGERFDVVACHQGMQFFPDMALAAREMRRALESGGRVAVATWRSLEHMPFLVELHQVAERRLGPIADRRHSITDPAPIRDLLAAAGFTDLVVETVSRTVRFADDVFVRMNAMALVGMSATSRSMSDDERAQAAAAIAQESEDVLRRYSTDEGLAFETSTFLIVGTASRS